MGVDFGLVLYPTNTVAESVVKYGDFVLLPAAKIMTVQDKNNISDGLLRRLYALFEAIANKNRAELLDLPRVEYSDFTWLWDTIINNPYGFNFSPAPKGKILTDAWIDSFTKQEWSENPKTIAKYVMVIPLWESDMQTDYRIYIKIDTDDFEKDADGLILVNMIRIP